VQAHDPELEDDFRGTARFEVVARLGAGGMGVVYHAIDRQRGGEVALKTLRHLSAASIYHLKQEFRSLAGVVHPNLVRLHELAAEGDRWFLTMELVRGVDFVAWVRPRGEGRPASDTLDETSDEREPSSVEPAAPSLRLGEALDLGRLRAALRQLAEGIAALHAAGKLHRDLKPSNVIVRDDGRVVILDFGLADELTEARADGDEPSLRSLDQHVIGTPEYMSPEQAETRSLSAASDWYAFGVMLFEALTGGLPFVGAPIAVLQAKTARDAEPPSRYVGDVPGDLDRLCADLLRRDARLRPSTEEILARLGAPAPLSLRTGPRPSGPLAELFGRAGDVAVLRDAFDGLTRGRSVIVHVEGESGAGKSALVRSFLDDVSARERTLVLSGRCYERESVPYKALDPIVDALSRYLRKLGRLQAEALLPRDVLSLARLFPVLHRTEAIARAPRLAEPKDPQELRKRAFQALRELFGRIGDRRALVIAIDDLQWADEDSARLIADVLRPPHAPRMMLVASYRREEGDPQPALRQLHALQQTFAMTGVAEAVVDLRASSFSKQRLRAQPLDVHTISLEPLPPQEARRFARALLEDDPRGAALAEAIASESLGNPLLLVEFVHFLRGGGDANDGHVTLERVIEARLRALPEEARRLIEVVCVAARPIATGVAAAAAAVNDADGSAALLRAHHLARTASGSDAERLEPYHDRIREAVVATLSPAELRDRHRRLARALEVHARDDFEALCVHFAAGGEPAPASLYAERAADVSMEALAFDRAVALLRRALELRGDDADALEIARLETRLGDALANAGRGVEAAAAFLRAGEAVSGLELVELRRKAAQQLLGSGHVDEALDIYAQVLGALGAPVARTPRRALAGVILRRLQLSFRGLDSKTRAESEVPRAALARVDTFWTLGSGLSMIDTVRGADFHARHLLAALDAGEPYRVARAIGVEACFSAILGSKSAPRTAMLLSRARALVGHLDAPHAIGVCIVAEAYEAYHQGKFRRSLTLFEEAEHVFRDRCAGVAWELANVHVFTLSALAHVGAYRDISAKLPALLEEAEARGDRFAHVTLRIGPPHVLWLAHDDPDGALRDVEDAMARWSKRGFHLQHYYATIARAEAQLYAGEAERALSALDEAWPALEASQLLRIQRLRIEAHALRGRAALATRTERGLALAARDARAIERERADWASGFAKLLRAGVAKHSGDAPGALTLLREASREFRAADMTMLAAATARRAGKILGGDEGRAMVAKANERLGAQEVVDPSRFARALAV
jgi:serine/threonine protein kinase/tetratricopeptide (TPR) repeat protein